MESSHDFFIRTTDPEHERRVQDFVQLLKDKGELYEGTYGGLYCSSCEVFYDESELIQPGNYCPLHPNRQAEWVEERNWFFPLKTWAPKLLELYDRNPEFVRPRARYNEARSLIAGGLEDVSFSRATVTWGVPLPWEPEQTIYVWVDALLNYRTALEYGLGRDVTETFWPTSLHVMAKDILRLHGIVWPAMLMAAGYDPPQGLYVHGYFTSGGQKMSKTLGNVIDPFEVIDLLGADALRFYLLREVQWGQDGDVTWEGLHRRYEGELANDLGNLVSRTTAMVGRYRDGVVPEGTNQLEPVHESVAERLAAVDLTGALEEIWTLVRAANRFVEERQPWALAKSDGSRRRRSSSTRRCTRWRTPCACWRAAAPVHPDGGRRRSWSRSAIPAPRRGSGPPTAASPRDGESQPAPIFPRSPPTDRHPRPPRRLRGAARGVWRRAAEAGVRRILTIGREQAIEMAGRFDGVRAVVGWHPHEACRGGVEALRPLLQHPQVVALGECGLDYYRDNAPRDVQRRVFAAQIELANEAPAAAGHPHPRGG